MARPKTKRPHIEPSAPAQPRTLRTTLDEIPRVDLPAASPARGAPVPLKGAPPPRTTSDGALPLPSLKPPAPAPGANPPLPRPARRPPSDD